MCKRTMFVAVVLALALASAACSGDGDSEEGAATGDVSAARSAEGGGQDVVVSSDQGAPESLSTSTDVPAVGPRVIQTASLTLAIERGRFQDAVDEARGVAVRLGGFVVSSTAQQGPGQRLVRGTLVVRVPARSYADAMRAFTGLGHVEARDESGQDVSQEFVDLEARVRHLRAVETQLLELLERANSVAAALAVQSQLNQVQLDLEQARGRLQYLEEQVAYATISLTLHERVALVAEGDGGRWGIVDAWRTAAHAFVAVVGWIFVIVASAAPALVLLALAYLVGRRVYRRRVAAAES